jgi:hypothetical protein
MNGTVSNARAWICTSSRLRSASSVVSIQAVRIASIFSSLGQYLPPAGYRSNLTGVLKGAMPVFWNVSKG